MTNIPELWKLVVDDDTWEILNKEWQSQHHLTQEIITFFMKASLDKSDEQGQINELTTFLTNLFNKYDFKKKMDSL